jgi:predicted dithiol-disulfide oxidoreductase (DUF899 family)
VAVPEVVPAEQWRAARIELLAEEKALTRARDQLNAKRRRLPMVEVHSSYVFTGPAGEVSLLDLFEGRRPPFRAKPDPRALLTALMR